MNEQTLNNTKLCAPYRIVVYNDTDTGVDTSSVVYDSNADNSHDPNNNRFTLSLDVGNYAAVITNSCGERVNGDDGYYKFSITDAYTFGASVVFSKALNVL